MQQTKKEKLALMKKLQKELEEEDGGAFSDMKCLYKALRGTSGECAEPVVTEYGFCKKHKQTVQARKCKDKFEADQLLPSKEEPVASPVKEDDKEEAEELGKELEKEMEEKSVKQSEPPVPGRLILRPNKWNRFEDPATGLVWDSCSKACYGIQGKNGKVLALTDKEIALCIKNRWRYQIMKRQVPDSDDDEENSDED